MSANDLIARFQQHTVRLAEGGAGSIELLLEQLEPETATCLKLCAIPHQFNVQILQVLAPDLVPADVQAQFAEIINLPITTFNPDGAALHDKTRRHLFQQWLGPPPHAWFIFASKRLVDYFTHRAAEINGRDAESLQTKRIFHLIGADEATGFDEFQAFCRQRRYEFRLNDCEHLIKLVHEYDSVLSAEHAALLTYHEGKLAADRCQWKLAEELFQRILKSAVLSLDLQIRVYYRLGMVRGENRDYSGAINYFQRALSLPQHSPAAAKFVHRIMNDLGAAYRDIGELDKAEEILQSGIKTAEEQRDLLGIALGYNNLGTLYRKKHEPYQAIEAYQQSLKYLADCRDTFRPAQVHINLGIVYMELSEWQQSRKYFEESIKITRPVGDKLGQAKALNNLIRVYQNLSKKELTNKNELAIDAAAEASKLFAELHDNYNEAITYNKLGRLFRRLQRRDEAIQALGKAIALFEKCGELLKANETREDLDKLASKAGFPVFWIIVALIFAIFILVVWLIIKL